MPQSICHSCGSSSFRLSRFRRVDLGRLLELQYPVRCRICQARQFLFVLTAFAFRRKGKNKGKRGNGAMPENHAA